jgi:hypothetical protein
VRCAAPCAPCAGGWWCVMNDDVCYNV